MTRRDAKGLYKCAACGNRFASNQAPEAGLAEALREYPGIPASELRVVCESCHHEIEKWKAGLTDDERTELDKVAAGIIRGAKRA